MHKNSQLANTNTSDYFFFSAWIIVPIKPRLSVTSERVISTKPLHTNLLLSNVTSLASLAALIKSDNLTPWDSNYLSYSSKIAFFRSNDTFGFITVFKSLGKLVSYKACWCSLTRFPTFSFSSIRILSLSWAVFLALLKALTSRLILMHLHFLFQSTQIALWFKRRCFRPSPLSVCERQILVFSQ